MANRFWVGNGGNWSDNTNHWSATTGGAPGASLPTSADSVFFDANSFTLAGQTVTVNVTANCLDMSWTGVLNSPTFSNANVIAIYGSLTFISAMTVNASNSITQFQSTSTGKTITTAGKNLGTLSFIGVGGGWTLQDNLTLGSDIQLTNGTLNTNGMSVSCSGVTSSNTNTRSLILGASQLTLSGSWSVATSTGMTLSAGTSTINLTGTSINFAGGGLTYYNVNLVGNLITISGNNTYNLFVPTAGRTIIVTAGSIQTTLINFVFKNNTLQSTIAGSAATLSKASGAVVFRGCSIKDITATGGAIYSAIRSSTSVSGNTGITFGSYVVVEKQLDGRKYVLNASGVLTAL